ncbi:MAG TPA: cell division protein ZipA C-terminal FtsZ-binding domain-containing protein [Steroidobacteraceae bacterium]|nr:cell division protein ZipA C-terminal FtsZ-binding domain-containing protein [Steroidobacteraceae bacterium]
MAGLRWILLGAGIALILGLWWWETRKSRLKPQTEAAPQWTGAGGPPDEEAMIAGELAEDPGTETAYVPTIERARVPRRPPLIEIPEDFEVDVSDFVGIDRRRNAVPEFDLEPEQGPEPGVEEAANEEESYVEPFEEPDDHHRAPWISTQPLERDEVAPKREEETFEPLPTDAMERRTAEASRQRIVALRLVSAGGPWDGTTLRAALEAEDLHYGPYSIFHREREDGKSLLYVASMMEPGSFDLSRMDEQEFSGVSLFGVVPGPLDAPSTFDLVLTVGRGLASRLSGQLQDEQGSTLTAQRILNLREELVQFEHRNRRLRRN